jgi:hypothetical protein
MYLYFFIIVLMIAYVIYHQYSDLYKQDKLMFKGELIDVNTFFFSDSYLKQSKNRKIWVHIPYEKNSRKWINFGSRMSTDLNLAYMTLCIKSIIDNCGENYDIFIIDDNNFSNLLDDDIDMNKLSGALKEKYREMCMLKVLYNYGGVILPPSLFLKKSIKSIDDPNKWYVSEINNTFNISYMPTYPTQLLMGSNKKNDKLIEYIQYYSEKIKNDFGEESLHFSNYLKKNKVDCLDGRIIGTKDKKGRAIMLEDLMENKKIHLHQDHVGVYIPHNELIKRNKYNWFCSLSAKEVLECNVFISHYMRT